MIMNDVQIVMQELTSRVLGPKVDNWFRYRLTIDEGERFLVEEIDDKVQISSSTVNGLSSGLYAYIRQYLHGGFDPFNGSQCSVPRQRPHVSKSLSGTSTGGVRLALNFCVSGFTSPYYDWNHYQELLDFLALRGFNLVLMPVGIEQVYLETFEELGYTSSELLNWIPNLTYLPWFFMSNMSEYYSPMDRRWYLQQIRLAHKILSRMSQLGMTPVFPGYSGMVPQNFENHFPGSKVIRQGLWDGFDRPDVMNPVGNPCFDKVARVFYRTLEKNMGVPIRYLAADVFHEGGVSTGMDMRAVGQAVERSIQANTDHATWVLQGWKKNPNAELLRGINKNTTLIQDLAAESVPKWNTTGFEGHHWLWCLLANYGGRSDFAGNPNTLLTGVKDALRHSANLTGFGMMAEAIKGNPLLFELFYSLFWNDPQSVDINQWLESFSKARYGRSIVEMFSVWQRVLNTVYAVDTQKADSAPESIIHARPGMVVTGVSGWGNLDSSYSFGSYADIIPDLCKVNIDNVPLHEDFGRLASEFLSNCALITYRKVQQAIRENHNEQYRDERNLFLRICHLETTLLAYTETDGLAQWVQQSQDIFGYDSDEDRQNALYAALRLVTTFGPRRTAELGKLHDYCNRDWAYLNATYYTARWQYWFDSIGGDELVPQSHFPEIDWFEWEDKWVKDTAKKVMDQGAQSLKISGGAEKTIKQELMDIYALFKGENL